MSEAVQALSSQMVGVLAGAAAEIADAEVSLVSLTLDVVGEITGEPTHFETGLDRKTRTLIFLNASALLGEAPVMTGTAVFAIRHA